MLQIKKIKRIKPWLCSFDPFKNSNQHFIFPMQVTPFKSLINVSVIGTAARDNDELKKMTADVFNRMVNKCDDVICRELKLSPAEVCLVSGGAVWSDHVAVKLYLSGRYGGLTLHLPCAFHTDSNQFEDNGSQVSRENPGRSANMYHRQFSQVLGMDTLHEIAKSQAQGAELIKSKGFHERNAQVAQSPYLIAFTWSLGAQPTNGGTFDTWTQYTSQYKTHVSLPELK
jgi:hypothetical protein